MAKSGSSEGFHEEAEEQHQHQVKKTTVLAKSSIAKDKLCDEEFDKLVVETSYRVSKEEILNQVNRTDSLDTGPSSQAGSTEQQPSPSNSNSRHEQDEIMDKKLSVSPPINLDDNSSSGTATTKHVDSNRLNQPKRPMNAFMVWGQAIRRNLHTRFSNVQNALLSKSLGRVWRSLDPAQKEPYVRKANLIKANHKRDYPDYRYQPRRIQERRNKGGVLIGISLRHPVNEQPRRGVFSCDTLHNQLNQQQQQQAHHTDFMYLANNGQHISRATFGSHMDQATSSLLPGYTNSGSASTVALPAHDVHSNHLDLPKEARLMDGVRSFEYQPYQMITGSSSSSSSTHPVTSQASRLEVPSFNQVVCQVIGRGALDDDYSHHLQNHHPHHNHHHHHNHTTHQQVSLDNNNSNNNNINGNPLVYQDQEPPNQQQPSVVIGTNKHPYSQQAAVQSTNYPYHHHHHQATHFSQPGFNNGGLHHDQPDNYHGLQNFENRHQQASYPDTTRLKPINSAINNYYESTPMTNMIE